jgi:amphi-Trp domain-containing protein
MSGSKTFKHETVQDLESILAYLDAIKEGLGAGKLVLAVKGKELVLEPKGLLGFEVEAKVKGDRRKLSLQISWKESALCDDAEEPLAISTR